MKWYIDRYAELMAKDPILSKCGDDCAVCPRFVASNDEELHEVAVLWYNLGWRDSVLSPSEMKCTGCDSHKNCGFGIVPCLLEHSCENCSSCSSFKCSRINDIIEGLDKLRYKILDNSESVEEYKLLERAFLNKEANL